MHEEIRIANNKLSTYKGYQYIVFYAEWGIMRNLCGYVQIPETHPAYKKVTKRSWIDSHLSHWKMMRDRAAKDGHEFNVPKPKSHRWYRYRYDDIDLHVHGGLTFGDKITKKEDGLYPQGFTPGFWVGWDYSHAGDEMYLPKDRIIEADEAIQNMYAEIMAIHNQYPDRPTEKVWEWDEVVAECKKAIRQLALLENGYPKCANCGKDFNPYHNDRLCWSCQWDQERAAREATK